MGLDAVVVEGSWGWKWVGKELGEVGGMYVWRRVSVEEYEPAC